MSIESVKAVIGSDCVLYFSFEERLGSKAYDLSGNNNNGTIYGAGWTYGKIGSGLSFDGVDDYVNVPNSPSLNSFSLTSGMSIEVWVFPYPKSTSQNIVGKTSSFSLSITPSGSFFFIIHDGSSWRPYIYSSVVGFNKWAHVVAVVQTDGTYMLYVNGSRSGGTSTTTNINNSGYPVYLAIGGLGLGLAYFQGIIDEVRIYNRALSEKEIKSLYYRALKTHQAVQI